MRRSLTGTTLVMAAVLFTGCGGDADEESKSKSVAATGQATPQKGASGDAKEGTAHEVTIEVIGEGTSNITYTLDTSDNYEKVTLPWKRTASIAARGAEQEVGRLVVLTPGNMTRPDGMMAPAKCSITVDGKKVVESDTGKSCSYKVK